MTPKQLNRVKADAWDDFWRLCVKLGMPTYTGPDGKPTANMHKWLSDLARKYSQLA